jgi:hypothetical protein
VRDDALDALVPGSFVDGTVELETGKGAEPSAKLSAHFRARVCLR